MRGIFSKINNNVDYKAEVLAILAATFENRQQRSTEAGDIMRASKTIEGDSKTLMASVYDRLRSDIVDGMRRPGEKMRFEELRETYGVGLSPLREALTRLAAEKLVVL